MGNLRIWWEILPYEAFKELLIGVKLGINRIVAGTPSTSIFRDFSHEAPIMGARMTVGSPFRPPKSRYTPPCGEGVPLI